MYPAPGPAGLLWEPAPGAHLRYDWLFQHVSNFEDASKLTIQQEHAETDHRPTGRPTDD